jgi:hypothetical protein
MKNALSLLLLSLLLISNSAPLLSAPDGRMEESFSDGTAYQVCAAAAPSCATSPDLLYNDYLAGRIILTDLGAVPSGRRYALQRADSDFVIIVDVTGV